jgi:hypothetical protein
MLSSTTKTYLFPQYNFFISPKCLEILKQVKNLMLVFLVEDYNGELFKSLESMSIFDSLAN